MLNELLKKSLMLSEKNAPVHGNLGLCFAKLGDKANALKELDRAIEINPRYELAIVNRIGILNLADGEKLPPGKIENVNCGLDYSFKKKSYIKDFIEKCKK